MSCGGGGHGQNGLGEASADGGWGGNNEIDPSLGNCRPGIIYQPDGGHAGWMIEVVNATGEVGATARAARRIESSGMRVVKLDNRELIMDDRCEARSRKNCEFIS